MSDPAFEAWKQRATGADILDVATGVLGLKLKRKGQERVGPCPRCGGDDRFSVRPSKQVFNCRGADGGDAVAMVMHVRAFGFLAACEIIVGEPPPARGTQLTAEQLAGAERAKAESAARAVKRDADENFFRQRERRTAFDIFENAHGLAGSSAEAYLQRRGLRFPATPEGRFDRIRCVESMPYFRGGNDLAEVLHRGPAMVLPIVDAARVQRGLHLTYLDLAQPKGKLELAGPDNPAKPLDAKKSRGSKQGNRVELIGPRDPRRLVLGEGAEKVIAVWQALDDRALAGELPIGRIPLDQTAFWSACDLGNLAGKHAGTLRHPTLKHASGRALHVAGAVPDLDAPAIVIPGSVEDLVLLGDSTSDEFTTRLAMCRAAARYAAPGRRVRVAWAPAGLDFDDLWRLAASDAERIEAAAQIAAIVEAAEAPVMPAIEDSSTERKQSGDSSTAARASDSEPGAPHDQTGAGNAGAPIDLPADEHHVGLSDGDPPGDPDEAALGPAPPPAAPPPSAGEKKSKPSRMGRSRKNAGADRGKWGGGDRDLDGEELDRALAFYPMTDLGNAERMTQRFRRRLMYSGAHGWFAWTLDEQGRSRGVWQSEDANGELLRAEHRTVRGIQDEAAAIEKAAASLPVEPVEEKLSTEGKVVELADVKAAKKAARDQKKKLKEKREGMLFLAEALRGHGRDSEQSARLSAIGKRAQANLGVRPSQLDAEPFLINVANGTLVVRRNWSDATPEAASWEVVNEYVRFKPHDPADLITKQMPVEFDEAADCPLYDEFLEFVQPNAENRRHLHQCGGMCLTGDISEQVMWFNWGKGKNGKSTLFNAWSHVIGDYGRSVAIETFLSAQRSGAGPSPDLARLEGVRFVRTSEPERGAKLAEALIKLATGGEPMTVRHLNMPIFELLPRFKLVMSGNYRPEIRGTDEGIWRRIKLVPWTVSIPPDKRDRDFGDKLKAEASGILNRLLAGLVDWLKHGLNSPAEIELATADYRKESDPLGRFLDACVETKEGERVQSTALHQLFAAWCRANGEKEWTATGLGRALGERGFHRRHSDVNYWLNIRMTKTVADFGTSSEPPPHGEAQNPRAGPPPGEEDHY
jgi:putative DNA primase/helicase